MVKGKFSYHTFFWFNKGIFLEGKALEVIDSAIFVVAVESAIFKFTGEIQMNQPISYFLNDEVMTASSDFSILFFFAEGKKIKGWLGMMRLGMGVVGPST